jgi:L-aminopeptidase/D-esterase-like protein
LYEAAALFDSFFFRPPQSPQDGELSSSAPVVENTTIGVIATNLALSKSEATNLARMAQTGVSRTTRPAHTLYDGDCLFALATGALNASVELSLLGAVAADVVAAAVLDGVRNADPAHGLPAASELTPRPLSQQS